VTQDQAPEGAAEAFARACANPQREFGDFFLARFYGLTFAYTDESCIITMPVHEFMLNPQGSLHGGVTCFVLDVAMGHLLRHASGPGITLGINLQYLRAPSAGLTTTESRFVKRGRSINFLEARMLDDQGRPVAAATSTWRLI
jgi:uncharacterized protein (TIGR00369 family)